jgi:hypothetical protein
LGFALTSAVLIGVLTYLTRDEIPEPVDSLIRHPRLGAVGGFLGQVVFMAVTAFVVARRAVDPAVTQRADALAGGTVIVFAPAVLLVAIHWGALSKNADAAAADTTPGAVAAAGAAEQPQGSVAQT